MVSPAKKMSDLQIQFKQMLFNATLVTEISMELRERAQVAEKYVSYLKNLTTRTSRTISTMQSSAKACTLLCQRLSNAALHQLETSPVPDQHLQQLKQDYLKLIGILEKELLDMEDVEVTDMEPYNDLSNLAERLRNLENKQRSTEQNYNLPQTYSTRSFRSDIDEKYPENWSRESLIDLNSVVNLPPVPEDIFTSSFKPNRTSSLSSLKSIRKVKLYLQRAVNSEDEESECDEHEMLMSDEPTSSSESSEIRFTTIPIKKGGALCNIKEETPQDP